MVFITAHIDIIASRKAGIPVAAAWADTAEPEKLQGLKPGEIFYTIKSFEDGCLTEYKVSYVGKKSTAHNKVFVKLRLDVKHSTINL